jgi:DNA polymerase III epsilon subunit-like protein
MLGALFIAAAERGIDQQELRDEIAPGLIGRRLSAASERQIQIVLAHVAGPLKRGTRYDGRGTQKKYQSSIKGLREEIVDLAKVRWGDTWSSSLNSLCRKFGVDHYNFLDIGHAKAVKNWFLAKA